MGLTLVHTEDLKLYSGSNKRCKCDAVNVIQDYDNGARLATQTTDENGELPDSGLLVSAKHAAVLIKTGSTYWRNVWVKTKVTWDGDNGALGLLELYLDKR